MIRWGVYCEHESDSETLRAFVLRLLHEIGADWVRAQLDLDDTGSTLVEWSFHKLKDIDKRMREHEIRALHGHFDGRAGEDGAAQARNAWQLERTLAQKSRDGSHVTDVVFVLRDADGKRVARAEGQRQAIAAATNADDPCRKPALLAALAIEEREAWVLAALVTTEDEQHRLEAQQRATGLRLDDDLDQLQNTGPGKARDLKTVLVAIVGPDAGKRELDAIATAPIEQLARRGASVGLWAALEQIAAWWVRCAPEHVDRAQHRAIFGPK